MKNVIHKQPKKFREELRTVKMSESAFKLIKQYSLDHDIFDYQALDEMLADKLPKKK